MMTTSIDYFQFAYDEVSESGGEGMNIKNVVDVDQINSTTNLSSESRKTSSASGGFDTDMEVKKSFVLRGWGDIKVFYEMFHQMIFWGLQGYMRC